MHPSNQKQLYCIEKKFNEIIRLHDLKIMPTKILLSGKKGSGKSTLAYHIINSILSEAEDYKYDKKKYAINENNKSYILVKNNTHPNFYLIDLINEKKIIEVEQIRKMINYTNKSSFDNSPRFILIDNIENLNQNSTNALLKIIEEPNENIFFILIHNNNKKIIPTLKSRCLTFNINLSFEETINITNLLLKVNLFEIISKDLINYYNSPGEILDLINFSTEKKINLKKFTIIEFLFFIIDNNYYKKNKIVRDLLINYIEFYFLINYKNSKTKDIFLNFYHKFINQINNANKFNLDEESLFIEFKSKMLNA